VVLVETIALEFCDSTVQDDASELNDKNNVKNNTKLSKFLIEI
jgi:hypothetical protein